MSKSVAVKAAVGVALVALGGTLIARLIGKPSGPSTTHGYYWDESAQRLYEAPVASITPHKGVDGGPADGWRATVYSCSDCTDAERKIAFLQRMSEELAALEAEKARQLASGGVIPTKLLDKRWVGEQTFVRRPGSTEWHASTTEEGLRIKAIMVERCPNGSFPRLCIPGD